MSRGPIPEDFDFPTPQRETNWTLPDRKGPVRVQRDAPRHPCSVADIAGAAAATTATYASTKRYTHKPDLFSTASIEGASPKRLIPIEPLRNNILQDKSLRTQDLPGAAPQSGAFHTTRSVNPLAPHYHIASAGPASVIAPLAPPAPLPAARPIMRIDDIEGVRAADNRSNTVIRTASPARDPINYKDVPMSFAGSKVPRVRPPADASATAAAEEASRGHHRSPMRHTNPLQPEYRVYGPGEAVTTIGRVPGSSPKPAPATRTDRPCMILRADDIEGAQPLRRFA